jgi:group I intron endonuclease
MTIIRQDQTTRGSGVYVIYNRITNRFYVGSSANVYQRFQTHRYYLKNNIHQNKTFQKDYHAYGLSSFEFIVVAEFSEVENAKECERLILKNFDYKDLLYNVYSTGKKCKPISLAKKGKPPHNKGKPHSEEAKAKISLAMKGKKKKPFSEETKAKLSESARLRWERKKKMIDDVSLCYGS